MSTLFEQLGGDKAVDEAVDIFYEKVLADDHISHFFYDTDMASQHVKQKLFLNMVFGGSHHYTDKNLREAHSPFVKEGLNGEHFNLVAGYLKQTLEEMKVANNLIDEVMVIVASTKADVLNL